MPSTGPGFKVPFVGLGLVQCILTWTVRVETVGAGKAVAPVLNATENDAEGEILPSAGFPLRPRPQTRRFAGATPYLVRLVENVGLDSLVSGTGLLAEESENLYPAKKI